MTSSAPKLKGPQIGQHPAGLYVLFFTEMWERFSYYGMRALLVYYMTKQLLFSQQQSSQIYGVYTGLVYLTPVLGGIVADRFLGQRKTVAIGAILMAIGQFLMGFESLFYYALAFLIVGNGAFKPNISTQVGGLYAEGDKRRDGAFSIFYMGINLGAFFSPLVCGTIGEVYGWRYGFWAAGVGMIAGLLFYLWGQPYLAPDNVSKKKALTANNKVDDSIEKLTSTEIGRITALMILCFFTVIFWACYEQQGNTLALWADTSTDRHVFGWEMPASWYQSFNPFMIFLFTPFITKFWSWQAKRGTEPTSVTKMVIGCMLLGISYLIMIPAANIAAQTGSASIWWLTGCTALFTLGELYVSPVGLSLVTKVAPVRMVSMIMGIWFLSSFFGNYLCGYLGTFWEQMEKGTFFLMLSALSMFAGLCMLALLKPLKKAISNVDAVPNAKLAGNNGEKVDL